MCVVNRKITTKAAKSTSPGRDSSMHSTHSEWRRKAKEEARAGRLGEREEETERKG